MEKEERIKKLKEEVGSLRELLSRLEKKKVNQESTVKKGQERIDLLKKIRERKIIDDDIPPF